MGITSNTNFGLDIPQVDVGPVVSLVERLPTDVDLGSVGDALESIGDTASDVVDLAVEVGSNAAVASARTAGRIGGASIRFVRRHPRGVFGVLLAVAVAVAVATFVRSRRSDANSSASPATA